jgi:saccharopine dehydrogenase-like NADP-dependent oxidoreductase
MKVLLLGVGMQGKAALHDLVQCKEVTEIIAADRDIEALKAYIQKNSTISRYGVNTLMLPTRRASTA